MLGNPMLFKFHSTLWLFCCEDHKLFFLSMIAQSDIYSNLILFISILSELLLQLLHISIISFLAPFSSISAICVFYSFPRDTALVLWCFAVMPIGVFRVCTKFAPPAVHYYIPFCQWVTAKGNFLDSWSC